MSALSSPKAILFDWDNTLVDTWPIIQTALNKTLRHMKHPQWSLEHVRRDVKKSMRDSFPEMFGEHWEEAARHYQQSYRDVHLEHLKPLPDAAGTLKLLRAQPIYLGVVSNKKNDTLKLELEHLGWKDYFDVAIGSGDAPRDKPSCDPALLALKDYSGARAQAVWFVGDTAIDLECAAAIGATPILYGDHLPQGNTHDGHDFAAHVRDHEQLQKLLKRTIGAA